MRRRDVDGISSRRTLVLVVAIVCTLVTLVVGVTEWRDRDRRLDAARREAATLARLLEAHTVGMLEATDLALLAITERLGHNSILREHDPAFGASLRRLLGSLPTVRALLVIGPDGFIVQDSAPDTPRRNLADRAYFRAHAEAADRGLFIGEPLISHSAGTWFLALSRRIETPEGDFTGVVVAAVDLRHLEDFYEELGLSAGDVITLAKRDSVLVARLPRADERVGEHLVPGNGESRLERALARAPAGSFEAVSTIDGTSRFFGYRTLGDHPLVVLVGLSQEQALMPWRRSAAAGAATTLAALALATLLLWITMRHARREAMVEARVAEATRLEALGRLTSGVAHDFNNLLQAVSAGLTLLRKRTRDDPQAAELISQSLASMEHGRSLVARLLGVARRGELQMREVDVNALLTGIAPLLRNAAEPSARVELNLASELQPCRADPPRLEAAVLNLVVNARDALPPGRQGKGLIRISTESCVEAVVSHDSREMEPRRFVCITVRDNGVGMPPEVRRRALEPFFTTKGERGTGLGLAQVYTSMREVGGDMQIESEIGAGTAVHLFLPPYESDEDPISAEEP